MRAGQDMLPILWVVWKVLNQQYSTHLTKFQLSQCYEMSVGVIPHKRSSVGSGDKL
jgi:hypothetical protein